MQLQSMYIQRKRTRAEIKTPRTGPGHPNPNLNPYLYPYLYPPPNLRTPNLPACAARIIAI